MNEKQFWSLDISILIYQRRSRFCVSVANYFSLKKIKLTGHKSNYIGLKQNNVS